jgi:glutamine synthetase
MVMQIIEETAVQYGLAALLQEKPFQGVNGSGKHNNWSIATDDGTNLLNVPQLEKKTGNPEIFPIIMAAIVKAIDQNGDLMRLAIATPGNDFRLGACEAPPSIISTYLGNDVTEFLESFKAGVKKPYAPKSTALNMGASALAPIDIPAEDRNRTSPFPYGGHRFEFRAVGSSQNVSLVNTVLATITAKAFSEFSDAIEKGATARSLAEDALKNHWRVIFNGNGYDPANQDMLIKNGLWSFNSNVDAYCRFTEPKNVKLFQEMKVFTAEECEARQSALLGHYIGTVEMELMCMIDMIQQHIIPSCKRAAVGPVAELESTVKTLKDSLHAIHHETDAIKKAHLCRTTRVETMTAAREVTDKAEEVVPATEWTLATYKELLFLDQHHG